MFRKIAFMAVSFGIVLTFNAVAGPFGLEMGMSLQDIGGEPQTLSNGKYKLTKVPKPHSAFEAYGVQVAPKGGLCWIKAMGKNISTSSHGVELKSAFSGMKKKLEAKYGKHKMMDFLLPGSIWNEPEDWTTGISKNERVLAAIWEKKELSSLPLNLESVMLSVKVSSNSTGYLIVEYTFTNEEFCEAELSKGEDDSL